MKLTNPSIVAQILQKHDLRFRRTLGQHFLIDDNIRQKIIKAAEINKEDVVLEVGPGIGTLSQEIALLAKKFFLIEIDKFFIPILNKTLSEFENVEVRQADALKINISQLKPVPTKMVSNLPYNISAPLIIKFLAEFPSIKTFVVMIQQEMADRLTAKVGTKAYGALSLKIAYLAKVEKLFKVSKNVFVPKPKVSSSVIKIERYSDKKLNRKLFKLIEGAFNYRRKTIKNALVLAGFKKDKIAISLKKASVATSKRAEELSLDDFIRVSDFLGV